MHIALVSKLSGSGGVAIYNRTLAKALVQLGHKVSIITSRNSPTQPDYYENNGVSVFALLNQHYARLHRLPIIGRHMRSLVQVRYSFRLARKIQEIDRLFSIDVIEFAEVGGEGFFYLQYRDRKPVVVRCHTPNFVLRDYHLPEEMPYNTDITAWMEKFSIYQADAVTTPSQNMAQLISSTCKIPENKIISIPNALDLDQYSPSSNYQNRYGKNDELIVLHVGRLERVKGIEVLADAIPLVVNRVPEIKFVFIGAARSDEQAMLWKNKIEKMGKGRVQILGFVDQEELAKWYQNADIAIVPSLNYESFSYTCAQAMAAGIPVVASKIGGIPETIDSGRCGILVEFGDAKGLAQAIVSLALEPNLRAKMGIAGQQKARDHFDMKIVADRILDIYATTINKTNQSVM